MNNERGDLNTRCHRYAEPSQCCFICDRAVLLLSCMHNDYELAMLWPVTAGSYTAEKSSVPRTIISVSHDVLNTRILNRLISYVEQSLLWYKDLHESQQRCSLELSLWWMLMAFTLIIILYRRKQNTKCRSCIPFCVLSSCNALSVLN